MLRVAGNIAVKLFINFDSFHLYPVLFFYLEPKAKPYVKAMGLYG